MGMTAYMSIVWLTLTVFPEDPYPEMWAHRGHFRRRVYARTCARSICMRPARAAGCKADNKRGCCLPGSRGCNSSPVPATDKTAVVMQQRNHEFSGRYGRVTFRELSCSKRHTYLSINSAILCNIYSVIVLKNYTSSLKIKSWENSFDIFKRVCILGLRITLNSWKCARANSANE